MHKTEVTVPSGRVKSDCQQDVVVSMQPNCNSLLLFLTNTELKTDAFWLFFLKKLVVASVRVPSRGACIGLRCCLNPCFLVADGLHVLKLPEFLWLLRALSPQADHQFC